MKCKHTHKISGKEIACSIETLISDIPIDKFDRCIFHSEDLKWKENNNFVTLFRELLSHIYNANLPSFGFHDFIFVGENLNLDYEIENILYLKKLLSKTLLTFYDCLFYCEVNLEQCVFKEALNIVNCNFMEQVLLNSCNFYNELNIFDNCTFKKKLAFYNQNTFHNNVQIADTVFNDDLEINNNQIYGTLRIKGNTFSPDFKISLYFNEFLLGFIIKNNLSIGLVNIEENEIKNNSLLKILNKETTIQLCNNNIYNELNLQGTESNLLFNPNTAFEIEKKHLKTDSSRIIFDYCNLLNLDKNVLEFLAELEENEKVIFNDTNEIARLTIIRIIDNRDIPEYILRDLFTLITRYFDNYYAMELTVNFKKLKSKNKTKIILTSKKLIEDDKFHKTFDSCVTAIFQKKDKNTLQTNNYNDLKEQAENIINRIDKATENASLKFEALAAALQIGQKNNISINKNKIIMGDKIKGDKNVFKKSQIASVGSKSKASKNSFENVNITIPKNLNFEKLIEELDKLKSELVSKAESADNYMAIAEVTSATKAAKKSKGKKVVKHLINAGKWTFNTAKDIGVEVVANLINMQMQ